MWVAEGWRIPPSTIHRSPHTIQLPDILSLEFAHPLIVIKIKLFLNRFMVSNKKTDAFSWRNGRLKLMGDLELYEAICHCSDNFVCFRYGISLSNKHISSVWPYISDTGSLPPESCVFGQLLNIAAFLCKFVWIYAGCRLSCDKYDTHIPTSALRQLLLILFIWHFLQNHVRFIAYSDIFQPFRHTFISQDLRIYVNWMCFS